MLTEMKINEFTALLASKEPAPGGGSVAALAGVMAASLGLMVVNLTVSKKAFSEASEQAKEAMAKSGAALEELRARLTALVDEDAAAFNSFMAAMKLPKGTDDEKDVRKKAMAEAEKLIIDVPYRTLTACSEVFPHLAAAAEHGNKNCISDAAVGAALAFSAMEGAMYNVLTNNPTGDERVRIISGINQMMSGASIHRNNIIQAAVRHFEGDSK